jgi:uncharacterized protein (AIM24 family)
MSFVRISSKMIEARVVPGARLFTRRGAMLAYTGQVAFTPSVTGGQGGLAGAVSRRVTNEQVPMMTAEGDGGVLLGHAGHHVHCVDLTGDTLFVEADRLLAYEDALRQSTVFLGSQGGVMGLVRGQATGQGLFTSTLTGHGSVAVLAHGGVIELPVAPDHPVHVDPQAYVGHRGDLTNRLTASVGWREMVGRGSGEAFQLELSGHGVVFVQASEEKL